VIDVTPEGESFDLLHRAFILHQRLHELGCELVHRPDWAGIPMSGILKTM
jgi:predicted trehalose synthase